MITNFKIFENIENNNFKNWFGKSKIVDEQGNPLVVYHGTRKDFDVFGKDIEKVGFSNKHRLWYFTKDVNMANSFAGGSEEAFKNMKSTGSIMPVYLSLQNPKILEKTEDNIDAIEDIGYWASDEQLDYFLSQGYDGIMLDDMSQIIVFDPIKIKSASGNNGEFNPNNPNINESFNSFSITDKYKEDLLSSHDGFNTREDAEEHLDSLLNWNYKNLPNEIYLYRILFINDKNDLNISNLGHHWTLYYDNIDDDDWIDMIEQTNDSQGDIYVLRAKFYFNDIDQEATLKNNILFPNEEEITLKKDAYPIEYHLFGLDEIRKIDSKKLRRINNPIENSEIINN
jgi:hypothetical protein